MGIDNVIKEIDVLFNKYNRDTHSFTVDYDEKTCGLYCNYTPYINHCGFAITDDLLIVCETSQEDLQKLKDYLDKNWIESRDECEWSVNWGWIE